VRRFLPARFQSFNQRREHALSFIDFARKRSKSFLFQEAEVTR
jgi:hypothetical protein